MPDLARALEGSDVVSSLELGIHLSKLEPVDWLLSVLPASLNYSPEMKRIVRELGLSEFKYQAQDGGSFTLPTPKEEEILRRANVFFRRYAGAYMEQTGNQ